MMNRITQQQAETLARLTASLRPGWDYHGIMAALERHADRTDAHSLSIALLAAAQVPTNETPAVIGYDGKHWDRAVRPGAMAPVPPSAPGKDTSPDCPNHPGRKAWECKACEVRTTKPANFEELLQQAVEDARAERVGA